MGASPTKKDLAFEFDWFDDNADPGTCAAHSHRPTAAMVAKVATAYGTSPVTNPDGTTGIHVIADYGQGGAFTGGNLVADADGVIAGGVERRRLHPDQGGQLRGQPPGHLPLRADAPPLRHQLGQLGPGRDQRQRHDRVAATASATLADQNVANTIVHEAGHNLGLRHGGNVDTNYKPNYNSVMNYQYQFPGIDTNCTVPGDGVLELLGRHPGHAQRGGADRGQRHLQRRRRRLERQRRHRCRVHRPQRTSTRTGSPTSVLTDFNDWANLSLSSVTLGASPTAWTPELVTEQPVPGN